MQFAALALGFWMSSQHSKPHSEEPSGRYQAVSGDVTPIELCASGEAAPVVMMLHTERDGYYYDAGESDTYATYLTLFVPDLVLGIIPATIPISPSAVVGDNGSGSLIAQISPKVHYAYNNYNRQWQNQTSRPYRYYPMMVHGKMVLGTFSAVAGGGWRIEVVSSLWMKDTPEYPFKNNVNIY